MRHFLYTSLCCCLSASFACAASPYLRDLRPKGGQRGTEVSVTLLGERLQAPQEVLFYDPGFEVLGVAPQGSDGTAVKVRLKIAGDCRLGEHMLRLRLASGLTDLRTFFVGALPSVARQDPNNDFASPQKIPLNVTVEGVVQNEAVDYYAVEAKKGQRITAEIEAMRLGVTMFDPFVAILDAKRFALAASDDTALLRQDSIASIIAPADGRYVIQVREASYGGSENSVYRLHVGTFPRPLAVYPAGGPAGEELDLSFLGDAAGDFHRKVRLPAQPQVWPLFAEQDGGIAPSPNPIRVSPFPNVLEVEPNNDRATATKTDKPLPLAFNGIISTNGDQDWFTFSAKKGQVLQVRAYARQLGSPLDTVVALYSADGKQLAENDDAVGLDSSFDFPVPADGQYSLQVRDHLQKGGPTYFYRVEVTLAQPALKVVLPIFNKDTQERQTIVVPRGNRYATVLTAQADGVDGDLALQWGQLPAGVAVQAPTMAGSFRQVPVVFEAPADAPLGGRLVDLAVHPVDPANKVAGTFRQAVNLVIAQPNDTLYHSVAVDRVAVAVAEEASFTIELVPPKAPLPQSGTLNLNVVATRKPGFNEPIRVQMLCNPPGVSAVAEITIPQGQTTGVFTVNADGGAPTRSWKIAVIGAARVNGGDLWVSSRLTDLEVASPVVAGTLEELVTVEQGKTAEIVCKLEQRRPFEGKAHITLLGLPPQVTTEERTINAGDKEIAFPLRTNDKSPIGTHKSLFCNIEFNQQGETIRQALGNIATLRIDPPPKKPAAAPPPQQVAAVAAPKPTETHLSRLEQLRLEQEQRAQGGGK
jgi:hypothetical protein